MQKSSKAAIIQCIAKFISLILLFTYFYCRISGATKKHTFAKFWYNYFTMPKYTNLQLKESNTLASL